MRASLPISLSLLLFALAPARAQQPASATDSASAAQERDARLVRLEGTVYLHLADQPEGAFIAAAQGMSLGEGDLVRTGSDGRAEVGMDGDTLIEVSPDTDFIVSSLDPDDTEFHLGVGSFVGKIQTLTQGQSMTFSGDSAIAAVRGTELAEEAEAGQPTSVGVFDEGHVSVTSPSGGPATLLGPGQETSVVAGKPPSPPGPLRRLAGLRARMDFVRRARERLHARWRPRPWRRRQRMRARMARRPVLRAGELRNVSAAQRGRAYRNLGRAKRRTRQGKRQAQRKKKKKRRP